jgi:phosphoribosyl-dephospho-CoA transferase
MLLVSSLPQERTTKRQASLTMNREGSVMSTEAIPGKSKRSPETHTCFSIHVERLGADDPEVFERILRFVLGFMLSS